MKTIKRSKRSRDVAFSDGDLPKGWRIVRFADVAESRLGKMLDKQKNKGTMQPYLRNPNVQWFNVDTSDLEEMPFEDDEDEKYGLREGDVVICEGGEAGRAAIWDGSVPRMKIQKAIHRVRTSDELFNRYLVYQLQKDYHNGRLADYYTGTTIKHLTGRDLAEYRFPLPPLPEQKRIAGILDKADSIRRKRQQAIGLTEQFLRSTFLDMFGDPVTNPKGWKVMKLGDAIDFRGGSQPPKNTFINTPRSGYVRLVQIRDFKTEKYATYIPKALAKREFTTEDVMVARYGPPVFQILRGLEGSYNVALMKASPKDEHVTRDFIFHVLQLPFIHDLVVANSERTAGQSGVNLRLLNSIDLPIPPRDVQEEMSSRAAAIESHQTRYQVALQNDNELFNSLVQRAFKGDL